jgi:hypothetical protein
MRTNPVTGRYCGNYRLVESYRNHRDRVCHRTMLNAGYLDELTSDQLNLIVPLLVINPEGYIKYSSILEGNMADSKTLEGMTGFEGIEN